MLSSVDLQLTVQTTTSLYKLKMADRLIDGFVCSALPPNSTSIHFMIAVRPSHYQNLEEIQPMISEKQICYETKTLRKHCHELNDADMYISNRFLVSSSLLHSSPQWEISKLCLKKKRTTSP